MFGTSAKYLALAEKEGLRAGRGRTISSALRAILSTGSPLAAHSYDYVYREHQARRPPGQHQRRHRHHLLLRARQSDWPGLARRAADARAGDGGRGVRRERAARCAKPKASWCARARFPACRSRSGTIPTAPSTGPPTSSSIPGVWRHGDWARLTEHDGLVILGRSDATLNPGGVRIGTAEIYRQVEQLPEVVESLVVGQEWDGDVRIVLFVRLREGRRTGRGPGGPDPPPDPGAREPSPRAAQDHAGGGHPADDQRQDHRARRARRDPRAARRECGRSGEPRRAGPVPGPAGAANLSMTPLPVQGAGFTVI